MSLSIQGNQFIHQGRPILLRGVGIANWLNLEHFLLGIPGTETEIRAAIQSVYGSERAALFWRTYQAKVVAEADLRFLIGLGMNCVRLPINARAFADGGVAFDDCHAVKELDRVVALCARHGLLCVLDLHAAPGGQNPDWHCDNATGDYPFFRDEALRRTTVSLWAKLARHFKDRPSVVGYDLLNEPCTFEPALDEVLLRFYADCIEAIRAVDERPVIFLEGNTYARDFTMMKRSLDPNVAYSFHYYPFLQLQNLNESANLKERIRDSLYADVTLTYLQETLGGPLWCGETGHPWHLLETSHALGVYLDLLEDMGISWGLWPHKDARAMGLCAPKSESRHLRLVGQASGGWNFWDMFKQDSAQIVQGQSDKHAHYRAMAAAASRANRRFRDGLSNIPFDQLLSSLEDWTFENCDVAEALLAAVRRR